MQCEHCKKRKATMFYHENINGKTREFQLCSECAAAFRQTGELEDMSVRMERFTSPYLLGDGESLWTLWAVQPPRKSSNTGRACQVCGQTVDDIKSTGRVGCETCYTTFEAELAPTLRGVHGGAVHVGRVPKSYRQKKEIQERIRRLKAQLSTAVSTQACDEAARLRDEIKGLEGMT